MPFTLVRPRASGEDVFRTLVRTQQPWLLRWLLDHARPLGFLSGKNPSDAWQRSVAQLSGLFLGVLDRLDGLSPDSPLALSRVDDLLVEFAVVEARRHLARGVPVPMFRALFPLYCESYLNLLTKGAFSPGEGGMWRIFIRHCFDRLESVCVAQLEAGVGVSDYGASSPGLRLASQALPGKSKLVLVCSSCMRIRDERGAWEAAETFREAPLPADLSHGICPECLKRLYPAYLDDDKN